MPRLRLGAFAQAALAALILGTAPARAGSSVSAEAADTALVLAVDVSGSVDAKRYVLQMEGIAEAFEDRDVQDIIFSGQHHAMFATLVEWSDKAHIVIPWTLITDREAARAFAEKIRRAPRVENQFTCMSTALQTIGGKVLPFLPAPAERTIIDVSGDGHDNCNPAQPVDAVRDQLVAAGATINGLPILEGDEAATLEQWYRAHVIGGPSAFLVPALGFADFERAMRRKFLIEISVR